MRNHQAGTRMDEGELFGFFNEANEGNQYIIMLSLPLTLGALSSSPATLLHFTSGAGTFLRFTEHNRQVSAPGLLPRQCLLL